MGRELGGFELCLGWDLAFLGLITQQADLVAWWKTRMSTGASIKGVCLTTYATLSQT